MFITGDTRGEVTLGSILIFVKGTKKEPLLEFKLHPSFSSRSTARIFCCPVILA